jgi:hypothetical protein
MRAADATPINQLWKQKVHCTRNDAGPTDALRKRRNGLLAAGRRHHTVRLFFHAITNYGLFVRVAPSQQTGITSYYIVAYRVPCKERTFRLDRGTLMQYA